MMQSAARCSRLSSRDCSERLRASSADSASRSARRGTGAERQKPVEHRPRHALQRPAPRPVEQSGSLRPRQIEDLVADRDAAARRRPRVGGRRRTAGSGSGKSGWPLAEVDPAPRAGVVRRVDVCACTWPSVYAVKGGTCSRLLYASVVGGISRLSAVGSKCFFRRRP